MLAEEKAQLGRVLLDMAHGVQQQFEITDRSPLSSFPRELVAGARPRICQCINGVVTLPPHIGEVGAQLILSVNAFGWVILCVECRRRKTLAVCLLEWIQ